MPETITHSDYQSIRISPGSPAITFLFKQNVQVVSLENLGNGSCFYAFNTLADIGSQYPILDTGQFRSFNLTVGSVSLYGTDIGSVQIIGLF